MYIKFEWDEAKRLRNLEKHGVDFAEVAEFEWGDATHAVDDRADYGETRIVSMMPHLVRLHLCCWTPRREVVRLITARKANDLKRAPTLKQDVSHEPMTDAEGEVRELTEADFARFRPTHEMPEVMAALTRAGRPPLPAEERKRRVTMFLDPDVVERLKDDGKGWQTRANAMLRKGLGL